MKRILLFLLFLSLTRIGLAQTTVYADQKYGFNTSNSQAFFYNAIRGESSTGNTLIFKNMGSPWYVFDEVNLKNINNLTIIFEKGCIVEAKKGQWTVGEPLLNIEGTSNLSILGYGATFKMYKSDFPTGEHSASIQITKANNLIIKGLTLDGSGGDGIYIKEWSNSSVEDVLAKGHKRQGVSIISANNVTLKNCIFRDTQGTDPQYGMDVEPNYNTESIKGLVVENCSFINNAGSGIGFALGKTDATTDDISARFFNCYLSNNNINTDKTTAELAASQSGNEFAPNTMSGQIKFENMACDGSLSRLFFTRKQASAYKVIFDNVVGLNMAKNNSTPPIIIENTPSDYKGNRSIGNIEFKDVLLKFDSNLPFLRIQGARPSIMPSLKDVSGKITVVQPTATDIEYVGGYSKESNDNVTLKYNTQKSLPVTTVNISTTVADATKTGQLGIARITRSSSRIDYPLLVKYAFSSPNVSQGNDIHYLTGAVVIKAGATSADIVIEARKNGLKEDKRAVTLTLEKRDLYTIGTKSSTQINILDTKQSNGLLVNGSPKEVSSYSDQDFGDFEVLENGKTIRLVGNTWKKAKIDYNIKPNTIIKFDVKVTLLGEVNGIGFDKNNTFTGVEDNATTFALAGTQTDTGRRDFATYTGKDWVTFTIPVGKFFTGTYAFMTFLGDYDLGSEGQESFFRNITLKETDITPPKVTSITATEITDVSFNVDWTLDEGSTGGVEWGLTTALGNTTKLETNYLTRHVQYISGLKDGTRYYYRVIGSDVAGNSFRGSILSATTLDKTPPKVTAIAATDITAVSFNVDWTLDEGSTGRVEWGLTTSLGNLTKLETNYLTRHIQSISGLANDTRYYFRVIGSDVAGNNFVGEIKNARTSPFGTSALKSRISEVPMVSARLFPNPTINSVSISGIQGQKEIYISDFTGKVIYQKTYLEAEPVLDLSGYAPGSYFIRIIGENTKEVLSVLKI